MAHNITEACNELFALTTVEFLSVLPWRAEMRACVSDLIVTMFKENTKRVSMGKFR